MFVVAAREELVRLGRTEQASAKLDIQRRYLSAPDVRMDIAKSNSAMQ